jgi:hypothetical protein
LETATRAAFSRARPSEVVLLSPACSSYDQFHDFEERGRKFKAVVEELAQEGNASGTRRPPFELTSPVPDPKPRPASVLAVQDSPSADDSPNLPVREDSLVEIRRGAAVNSPTTSAAPTDPLSAAGNAAPPPNTGAGSIKRPSAPKASEVTGDRAGLNAKPDSIRGEEATPADALLEGPDTEKPEFVASHPERIYVYELEAEVRPPTDMETEVSIDDVVLDQFSEPATDNSRRPVGDEPLMFEVADARSDPSDPAESASARRSSSPEPEKKVQRRPRGNQ